MEIAAALAALQLLEKLIPIIASQVKSGEVTKDEQQKVHDQYTQFRATFDRQFQGPEWEIEK